MGAGFIREEAVEIAKSFSTVRNLGKSCPHSIAPPLFIRPITRPDNA